MPVVFMEWIERDDLREHPEWLFVFGDNLARLGNGGQAKSMRGEPNAVGLPTKRFPSQEAGSFLCDDDVIEVANASSAARKKLAEHVRNGGVVVWPMHGIGTGLARLPKKAPRIYSYYENFLEALRKLPEPDES